MMQIVQRWKRLVITILATLPLVFAGAAPAAVASAAGTSNASSSSTSNSKTNSGLSDIQCGLLYGSLFLRFTTNPQCGQNTTSNGMSGSSSQSRTNNKRTTPNNGASGTYAALGDSVAAGLGLPLVASPSTEDQECGRSSEAYGQIVASKLHDKLIFHACSGATAGDLFTQQHIKGPNPPAQLDGVFAHGTPELITVTAGANDAHWQSLLKECYATNCDTKTNTVIADGFLKVLQLKLYTAMYDIQARSHGTPPEVIFTGYYDPLSQQCSQQQSNITPQELSWIAAETSALNQTIKNVTQHFSFAKFATVDFTGHDLCSSDSWIQGLNASAPFHPTARGQQAIANSVLAKVNQP